MKNRRIIAFAATATAMVGLFVAPASSASAAVGCRSSANLHQIHGTDDDDNWPGGNDVAVTTANCVDIQVKLTASSRVRTCFQPSSGGEYCNAWRDVPANIWTLTATSVKDGTKFRLRFDTTEVYGVAAY